MTKLWGYEDYVDHLSHQNDLVRRWAFGAIENRYPNRYTDEVSKLIGDKVEHLACAAPKYLAKHDAVQHAPAILESFKNGRGYVPGNCAIALGHMSYEPALDVMLEYFSQTKSSETFVGILNYFGDVRHGFCREALKSVIVQIQDAFVQGAAVTNLLKHHTPEDIPFVLEGYVGDGVRDRDYNTCLRDISYAIGGGEYYGELAGFTQTDILKNPGEPIDSLISGNSNIKLDHALREDMIRALDNGLYEDFSTIIALEARRIVDARYSENAHPDWLEDSYGQDIISLTLLEELSKRSFLWNGIKKSEQLGSSLISFILSALVAILERDAYLNALSSDAVVDDMIRALKNSGPGLPKSIQEKIKQVKPISQLRKALTEDLMTWGDIWAVRIMGQIGSDEFVPDLIKVLRSADSLDYIYSDATRAMNALDEFADKTILAAVKNKELGDWESFPVLEYLPYSEAYDLALQRWEDENNEMDSYELFGHCLRGIGDPRGIKKLQYVYANENDATYIGDDLECLSVVHKVDIPEMPDILSKRKDQEERQKARQKELRDLAANYRKKKEEGMPEYGAKVVPFKRESPKVGRNEPCPCGSGKKYKKCCLK